MVFSDPAFLVLFLPIAALLILCCARFAHSLVVLLVSLLFYFWSSGLIVFVLVFFVAFNWGWALVLQKRASGRVLAAGITVNLLVLCYYKYAFFFAEQLDPLFQGQLSGTFRDVVLPIGISFFTFQSISYLVDVYRHDTIPERNPIRFGAYLSFFPQLIAGPIVRFRDVIDQYAKPEISLANFSAGLSRFVHGLLKKVVIADSAGAIADACFALPQDEYGMAVSWLGALAYAIQIYFDFSGYSDMAIGLGMMFGIRFNENFTHPYSATTVTEFWRRWHISLSTWFRDYLYIPLGGNRASPWATYRNLLIVFAATGLWHGAAWTFVVWGMYHGAFLLLERVLFGQAAGRERPVAWRFLYLLPVVLIGWVIFRADSLPQAGALIAHLFLPGEYGLGLPPSVLQAVTPYTLAAMFVGLLAFVLPRQFVVGARLAAVEPGAGLVTARLVYCSVGLPMAMMLAFSAEFSPFLYFRF